MLNLNNEVESLTERLGEAKLELHNVNKAQLKQSQENHIQLSKLKEGNNLAQKNLGNCLAEMAKANETIANYKSELYDLKHEANQQSLVLKEQQVIESIAGQVSKAVAPVSDLSKVIDKATSLADSKKKDDKQVITAITSLETSMLNLQEVTKKIEKATQMFKTDKKKTGSN